MVHWERVTITANEVLQKSSQLETDSSTRKIGRSVFFLHAPQTAPMWLHATVFAGSWTLGEPRALKADISSQHAGDLRSCPETEGWEKKMATAVSGWSSDAGIWGNMFEVSVFSQHAKYYCSSTRLQIYLRAYRDLINSIILIPYLCLITRMIEKLKRWKSKCQIYFW